MQSLFRQFQKKLTTMKNIIVITTDINESYNFAFNVIDAKKRILEYFGNKYATHDAQQPVVCTNRSL